MKENKEDGKFEQKTYSMSQILGKQRQIDRYNSLVKMLSSQVELYQKAIAKLNNALELYHNTIDNLAQFFDISPLAGEANDDSMEKLKIWLFSVEEYIINTIKTTPKQIQKTVQIQKIVTVETPVFVEKIVEVDRPITVIQEIQREVQKPVYIQKIVEVPIFVEKNKRNTCVKCSGVI